MTANDELVWGTLGCRANVLELVDKLVSEASAREGVGVQVSPFALPGLDSAAWEGVPQESSLSPEEALAAQGLVVDVRAPVEFGVGHFPGAMNLAILSDWERARVGTVYKQYGSGSAQEEGRRLIGALAHGRVGSWVGLLRALDAKPAPHVILYCWRGGLRSEIASLWLRQRGLRISRVVGGYKALRLQALAELRRISARPWVVLSGPTGSGKTDVVRAFAGTSAIDLEGLAQHRGSAFGGWPRFLGGQPTQATFENALGRALAVLTKNDASAYLVEDESRTIGRCVLPPEMAATIQGSAEVRIEEPLESRAHFLAQSYLGDLVDSGFAPDAMAAWAEAGAERIRKRLGGARTNEILTEVRQAFACGVAPDHHVGWVARLLREYYDPMYRYGIETKGRRLLFVGSRAEVVAWWRDRLRGSWG